MKLAYSKPTVTFAQGKYPSAKDIFPFATVTDGCEEANFVGFSHEYGILDTTFYEFSQKM